MSTILSNVLSPLSFAVIGLSFFIAVAGLLVWYALRNNDEVQAEFGHGKTIFKLKTKKRRDAS